MVHPRTGLGRLISLASQAPSLVRMFAPLKKGTVDTTDLQGDIFSKVLQSAPLLEELKLEECTISNFAEVSKNFSSLISLHIRLLNLTDQGTQCVEVFVDR